MCASLPFGRFFIYNTFLVKRVWDAFVTNQFGKVPKIICIGFGTSSDSGQCNNY